jgi:hypothetical protein
MVGTVGTVRTVGVVGVVGMVGMAITHVMYVVYSFLYICKAMWSAGQPVRWSNVQLVKLAT